MRKDDLPIFTGKDFPVWKMVLILFLSTKSLKQYVTCKPDIKAPEEVAKDEQALTHIARSLDLKQARLILGCKHAKDAWDKLFQVHEQKSEASKIGLRRQFFAMKMEKDEGVADYVSRVEYLRSQLEDVQMPVAEATVVAKIFSGLPPSYKSFCTQWGGSTSLQQRVSFLLGRLLEEEALQASYRRAPKEGIALNADSPGKRDDKSKGKGNGESNGKGKGSKCYNCGKEGH